MVTVRSARVLGLVFKASEGVESAISGRVGSEARKSSNTNGVMEGVSV